MFDRIFFRLMDELSSLFEAIGLASHEYKRLDWYPGDWPNDDIDRRLP